MLEATLSIKIISQPHEVVNLKRNIILRVKSDYYMDGIQSQENQQSNAEKWLTTTQVIQLLDISRGTLYRLESEGKLKPIEMQGNKILKHRRIRFSREAVENLMLEFNYDCLSKTI